MPVGGIVWTELECNQGEGEEARTPMNERDVSWGMCEE